MQFVKKKNEKKRFLNIQTLKNNLHLQHGIGLTACLKIIGAAFGLPFPRIVVDSEQTETRRIPLGSFKVVRETPDKNSTDRNTFGSGVL